MARHEGRTVGPDEREQLLEPAGLSHPDVDEVDAARVHQVVLAGDLDLVRDGLRLVRDVEAAARRRPEREEDDGEERGAQEDEPVGVQPRRALTAVLGSVRRRRGGRLL